MSDNKKVDPNNPKTVVDKPMIPQVAYPLKAKSGTNNNLQEYFNRLKGDASSRFLFNKNGLWHQGIHLRASQFKGGFEVDKIYAIAKGRLLAYKVDSEYREDKLNTGESAVYSTGFFLLDHHLEYPKGNKLTFYSLYRHTAKLSEYPNSSVTILGETFYKDGKITIKDEKGKIVEVLPNGVLVLVKKQIGKEGRDKVIWYKKDGIEYKPQTGSWSIHSKSYRAYAEEQIPGLPLLSAHKIETQVDREVVLDKPIEIAAGAELGLMGEYNQIGESQQKLLHLELFTYDDIEAFREKARAAYKEDKKQKRIEDNFLYVDRNSPCYSITDNVAVELELTQTEIMVPLSEVEKVTLKQGKESRTYYNIMPYLYNLSPDSKGKAKNNQSGIYVDDSHLTHGILFPGVNVYKEQSNTLSIFKMPLHEYLDPNNGKSLEEKNQLDNVFKAIMQELDLEKDKDAPIKFEAGKLDMMSLSPIQHRRLAGIVVKHDSEWKSTRQEDFTKVCALYREKQKVELAECIDNRVKDLSISIKVGQFDANKQAYYIHPLGIIGLFSASLGEFDWFETPLVKLILSKESKGSFNAYNITGWKDGIKDENHFRVFESSFSPRKYHLEKMTIAEIQHAQYDYEGREYRHLFAVGVVQMIPSTLTEFLVWLNKYKSINKKTQLFDESFQRLTPIFFWEKKVKSISLFFKGQISVEKAAYAISKEWASAGVPMGELTQMKRISNGGLQTYYDKNSVNKAHYPATQTIDALESTKKLIDAAGGYNYIRDITLLKIGS